MYHPAIAFFPNLLTAFIAIPKHQDQLRRNCPSGVSFPVSHLHQVRCVWGEILANDHTHFAILGSIDHDSSGDQTMNFAVTPFPSNFKLNLGIVVSCEESCLGLSEVTHLATHVVLHQVLHQLVERSCLIFLGTNHHDVTFFQLAAKQRRTSMKGIIVALR